MVAKYGLLLIRDGAGRLRCGGFCDANGRPVGNNGMTENLGGLLPRFPRTLKETHLLGNRYHEGADMAADNGKIQISQNLLAHIMNAGLSLASLKLLIAMIHHQELKGLWISDAIETPCVARTWGEGTRLRSVVGPKRENGATSLHKLIAETQLTELFDKIRLVARNRVLEWQFSSLIHELMRHREVGYYTLLDLSEVANCRTREDFDYLITVRHLYKAKAPKFMCPSSTDWGRVRARHMTSMARIATMTGVTLMVAEARDKNDYKLHHVTCRICHPETTWWISAFKKHPVGAKVTLLDSTGARRVDPATFDFTRLPGVVPDPP